MVPTKSKNQVLSLVPGHSVIVPAQVWHRSIRSTDPSRGSIRPLSFGRPFSVNFRIFNAAIRRWHCPLWNSPKTPHEEIFLYWKTVQEILTISSGLRIPSWTLFTVRIGAEESIVNAATAIFGYGPLKRRDHSQSPAGPRRVVPIPITKGNSHVMIQFWRPNLISWRP